MANIELVQTNPLHLLWGGVGLVRRLIEELVDDIGDEDATDTVTFSYLGTDYEIDLSARDAARLGKALAPYLEGARKVTASPSSSTSVAKPASDGIDPRAAREWAMAAGIKVASRGRVSADILRRYQAAQG